LTRVYRKRFHDASPNQRPAKWACRTQARCWASQWYYLRPVNGKPVSR
jgi:hypothetical protein